MGVVLTKLTQRLFTARNAEVTALSLVFGYFILSPRLFTFPLCWSVYFTDTPCPTCGTTRALWSIFHGQFEQAWDFNPLGFLVVLILSRRLVVLCLGPGLVRRVLDDDRLGASLLLAFLVVGFLRVFGVV